MGLLSRTYNDPENEEGRGGFKRIFFFLIRMSITVTLSFILLSTISYFVIKQFVVVSEVKAPNVVGLTLEAGLKEMTNKKFTLVFDKYEYSKVLSEGRILSQYPPGGTLAKKGSPVRVTLSQGSPLVKVPDLRGETEIGAGIKIRAVDLKVGDIARKYDARIKKYTVIAQDPPPGSGAPLQQDLKLLVSMGVPPKKYLMPSFYNMTLSEARQEIEEAGFEISETQRGDDPLPRNRVIRQKPRPGTMIDAGEKISLRVSTGMGN